MTKAKAIAFYLPQFHQIPENDEFWGKGFTDWSMVKDAKPLFKNHKQPKVPLNLGYYDLLHKEVRKQQGELAKINGLSAFCYWHYYFGNQKTVLDKPLLQMLEDGEPDFPFMFGWANQSWTANWKNRKGEVLIKQEYHDEIDIERHFEYLLPFFKSPNYLRIGGKLPFLILYPDSIPNLDLYKSIWDEKLREEIGAGIEFIGYHNYSKTENNCVNRWLMHDFLFAKNVQRFRSIFWNKLPFPLKVNYEGLINRFRKLILRNGDFPLVYCNWDNTPRMKKKSFVFTRFTPENFGWFLNEALQKLQGQDEKYIFIKSWNEWAEGNYLEPDKELGDAVLRQVKKVLGNS
jgi:lipopolysaccharide biosynthesis protein